MPFTVFMFDITKQDNSPFVIWQSANQSLQLNLLLLISQSGFKYEQYSKPNDQIGMKNISIKEGMLKRDPNTHTFASCVISVY